MKSVKILLFTLLLGTISINAMDLEKDEKEKSTSLLEQLKESASEYDNVRATKDLIKQIRTLKKTEAQKTKNKFTKWLHEQLEDAREHVINGRSQLKTATIEGSVALTTFCLAYLGFLGEPLVYPIVGGFAFIVGIIWAIETGRSFKHFNQAEPIAIYNNEIRQMLKLLDQVTLKKKNKK